MMNRPSKQGASPSPCAPPLTARESRSRQKRQQIIDAAGKRFLDSGYGATSMDTIAAEAGVSKRTVYAHFDNKEALFIAVIDRLCMELTGLDPNDGPADGYPVDRLFRKYASEDIVVALQEIGGRLLDLVLAKEPIRLFRIVVSEAERFPELGRLFFEHGPKRVLDQLTALIEAATADGRIAPSEPARDIAWRFVCDVKDPHHLMMAIGVAQPPSPAEKARLVDRAIRRFLDSVTYKERT